MTPSLRIAVAEDEPDMLEYYRRILTRLGHTVVCSAGDGETLLEFCRDQPVDLTITDLCLPGIDGLALAQHMALLHSVPVILISANDPSEPTRRAMTDYVMAYLVKPIKKADLETAIEVAWQRFRERKPADMAGGQKPLFMIVP